MIARALLLASLFLGGCSIGTLTPEEFEQKWPYGDGYLFSQQGAEELRAAVTGKLDPEARLTSFVLSNDMLTFILRRPDDPGDLDRYYYTLARGWDEPRPERSESPEEIEAKSFSLKEIPFEVLPGLIQKTEAELHSEGGKVQSISLDRNNQAKTLELHVGYSSPRRSGYARFDLTGKLLQVSKN